MAWEKRHNNTYYYRKHRRPDGSVASQYLGRGPAAERAARLDQTARAQKRAQTRRWQQTKAEIQALETTVDDLLEQINLIRDAALLAAGCYQHKGQWRKKSPQP